MTCAIKNQSNYDTSKFEPLVQDLYQFADQRFGFKQPPTINFVSDDQNHPLLGKTGYYDPNSMEITIFVDGRHPKDMMRSISHEFIHHKQNEMGMFDRPTNTGAQYAQKDPHLRKMEAEAYLKGNMCFRDWEDGYKAQHKDIFYERRIHKMSTKKWKNKELNGLLNERWGFSMDLGKLNEKKSMTGKDPENYPDGADSRPPDGEVSPYEARVAKAIQKNQGDKPKKENKDKEDDKPEAKSKDKKKDKSDHEGKILGVLEAEGGAAGMDAIVKQTGLSKDEIRKAIKDSDKMEKHRDGDIIDTTGLKGHSSDKDDQSEAHCNEQVEPVSEGHGHHDQMAPSTFDSRIMSLVAAGFTERQAREILNMIFDEQESMPDEEPMPLPPPSDPMSGGNSGAPMRAMQEKKIRKAAKEAIRRLGLKKRK